MKLLLQSKSKFLYEIFSSEFGETKWIKWNKDITLNITKFAESFKRKAYERLDVLGFACDRSFNNMFVRMVAHYGIVRLDKYIHYHYT